MRYLLDLAKENIVQSISVSIVAMLVAWGITAPEEMVAVTGGIMDFIVAKFGWFYVIATALFIIFCIYLGIGPYRQMKLGKKGDEPEYTYLEWIGMLFAAGMGVGLVFWGTAEPLSHFAEPPPGIEPKTKDAAERSLLYSVFHWGTAPMGYIFRRCPCIGFCQIQKRSAWSYKFDFLSTDWFTYLPLAG